MLLATLIGLSSLTLAKPKLPDLQLDTFDNVCKDVVRPSNYRLGIEECIKNRPVVFHLENRSSPLKQLKGLCQTLFLTCDIDHDKKTIYVYRSAFAKSYDRQTRTLNTLAEMNRFLKPYSSLTLKEVVQRCNQKQESASNEPDDSPRKERMEWEANVLTCSYLTQHTLLMQSVLQNLPASTKLLCTPGTFKNRLLVSASAMPLLDQYLAGKGSLYSELADPRERDPESWELLRDYEKRDRENALAYRDKGGMLALDHIIQVDGYDLNLFMILPNEVGYLSGITIKFLPIPNQMPAQDEKSFDKTTPIKNHSAFSGGLKGLTSVGGLAIDNKWNYASWLPVDDVWFYFAFTSVEDMRWQSNTLRVSLKEGWLQVVDYANPFPYYDCDWRPFIKLRSIVDDGPKTSGQILEALNRLSNDDLHNLEVSSDMFKILSGDYFAITSGARLLRAVLRQAIRQKSDLINFSLPIENLDEASRQDALAFFDGYCVWQYWKELFHPQNRSKIGKIVLQAKIQDEGAQRVLHWSAQFPKGIFDLPNTEPIEFQLPIAVETPTAQSSDNRPSAYQWRTASAHSRQRKD